MAPEKQERSRVDNREVINDVLVNLFNEILRLEEEAIITDKYKDISNNDMHIIEAVGLGGGNMSEDYRRFSYHFHEQPCKEGLCKEGAQ